MLLIPEVSKTFLAARPRCVAEHARIVPVLLRVIATKSARGEIPSDLWLDIVAKEIRWSCKYRDKLTFSHRQNVADLLEWYCSQVGDVDESLFVLFSDNERDFRLSRAALDYLAPRVALLSLAERELALNLLDDFCDANPAIFHDSWRSLI